MTLRRTIVSRQIPEASVLVLATLGWCAVASAQDVAVVSAPVVNGRPAEPNEFFGTVGLIEKGEGNTVDGLFCTGTLISPTAVLTAAHCVFDCDENSELDCEIVPLDAKFLGVAAGFRDAAEAERAEVVQALQVYVHEGYEDFPWEDMDVGPCIDPPGEEPDFCDVFEGPGLGLAHDIAVVVLATPITSVQPVPILPQERVAETLIGGSGAVVTGYGATSEDDFGFGDEPLLNIAPTSIDQVTATEILTYARAGEGDACFGDSGGPLYVHVDDVVYLAGVTSRGRADVVEFCGPGGIYTLAPSYLDWIQDKTKGDGPPTPSTPTGTLAPGESSSGCGRCVVSAGAKPSPASSLVALAIAGLIIRRRRQ